MRRLPTGPAIMLAASALLMPQLAFAANNNAEPPAEGEDEIVEDPEDEGELVLDEEEMEAAPEEAPVGVGDDSFLDGPGEDPVGDDQSLPGDGAAAEGGAAAEIDPEEQQKIDEDAIVVVQRQAFLNVFKNDEGKTVRRFELQPFVGLSVNDPFVRHYAVGAEFDFWLTNRMAIGLTGQAFFGNRTPAYDRIRFQNGLLLTANRSVWEASVTYLYEPIYGKVALFNRFMLHWEAYTQIGFGIIQTQVIPRFEAIHDPFNNFNPQGNFAIGSRFYVKDVDFFSFNFAVRNFIYLDRFEPTNRGPTSGAGAGVNDPALDDPDAAKDEGDRRFAFNTMLYLGVSFYLPPKFQYSTRR